MNSQFLYADAEAERTELLKVMENFKSTGKAGISSDEVKTFTWDEVVEVVKKVA